MYLECKPPYVVFIQVKFIVALHIHLIIIEFFRLQKKADIFHCPVPQIWVWEIRIKQKMPDRDEMLTKYFVTGSKVMGENSSQKGVLNYEQSLISARD